MNRIDSFWWADTTLCIQTAANSDRRLYLSLLNALRRDGFKISQDEKVSKIIRSDYHAGGRQDLLMQSHTYPTGSKIEFFQNVVHENPHGGRFDFNRLEKMPYLIRVRFLVEKRILEKCLIKRGFIDRTKPDVRGLAFVEHRRQELRNFQGQSFYDGPRQKYNATDADGKHLSDGDFRYFYTYGGRLCRGTIYHNINNMWWAVVNSSTVHNIACFHFFSDYDPAKHPARRVENPQARIKSALDRAVKEQNFERAIGLRNALNAEVSA